MARKQQTQQPDITKIAWGLILIILGIFGLVHVITTFPSTKEINQQAKDIQQFVHAINKTVHDLDKYPKYTCNTQQREMVGQCILGGTNTEICKDAICDVCYAPNNCEKNPV